MTYRLRNIGIAIALAVVAALLTTFYVTNYKRSVQHGESKVPVYVASRDIELGTAGSDVARGGMLRVEQVPRRSVVPGAISNPDQIEKLVAVDKIYAGEQVSTNRFRPVQEQGVQAQLKGNLRALRVDILGNWLLPETSQNHISRVLLRNILVLQAPSTNTVSSHLGANPNEGFNVMLAMTDSQATKFWWVVNNGDWSLELRPITDPSDSPEELNNSPTNTKDGASVRQWRRALGGISR
jgi:Flp pilus assembly protein CpaB